MKDPLPGAAERLASAIRHGCLNPLSSGPADTTLEGRRPIDNSLRRRTDPTPVASD